MTSYDDSLLICVSEHPILYNHMRRDYKNSECKQKAWEDIQKVLDTDEPVEKIRQRWKSIRDSYVKYINKTRDRPGSKVRPYKFEKRLSFLKPYLIAQKDGSNGLQFEDTMNESTEQILLTVTPRQEDCPESPDHSNKRRRANSTEHFMYENQLQHESSAASSMAAEYRMFSQMDDIDIFFYGIAQTMKKLRPLTVAKLKKVVANLVTDAEIRELEQVEYHTVTHETYAENETTLSMS